MTSDAEVRLNASQRRHYEILFARLERSLVQLEASARGDAVRTTLTVVESDLPARFVQEAGAVIADARRQLAELAEVVSVRPRVESRRRVCRTLITSEVNDLTDATSARLGRFGEVDPSVAEHLDPALEELRRTVARLGELLG